MRVRVVANVYCMSMLVFTLTTSAGQTSGRCIAQLAKMTIDTNFIELTADVFRRILF